jgi:hypothetical protein
MVGFAAKATRDAWPFCVKEKKGAAPGVGLILISFEEWARIGLPLWAWFGGDLVSPLDSPSG